MAKTAVEMIRGATQRAQGRSALVRYAGTDPNLGTARYVVDSATDIDVAYQVTVNGSALFCECPAAGLPACWHRAAVHQVRAGRRAWGLEVDGPTAQQLRRQDAARNRMEEIAALFAA